MADLKKAGSYTSGKMVSTPTSHCCSEPTDRLKTDEEIIQAAVKIRYYVDGVLVRSVENTHWHQPLALIFDSETMPNWFGMPEDEDLPSTFKIEYVRAWKK